VFSFVLKRRCNTYRLCVPILSDDEAVVVKNVWRHSRYSGYLDTFKFVQSMEGKPIFEEVIAIDALTSNHFANSVRDLRKCYVGFSGCRAESISTGKWGCGVFGGDYFLGVFLPFFLLFKKV
jgi:poly(ADP-ribose) glycohydrolase